jgi:predicted ester cyclase
MKNENEEIIRQFIETIVNTGNDEDLSLFVSPRYTEIVNKRKYQLGIEGIRKKIARIREMYPDLKLSIDLQITEGNWVVTSYVAKATQLGNWMGLQSTGKSVEVWGVDMDKIVDGKIAEHVGSPNLLDPLIGVHTHPMHLIKDHMQKILDAKNEDKAVHETESA